MQPTFWTITRSAARIWIEAEGLCHLQSSCAASGQQNDGLPEAITESSCDGDFIFDSDATDPQLSCARGAPQEGERFESQNSSNKGRGRGCSPPIRRRPDVLPRGKRRQPSSITERPDKRQRLGEVAYLRLEEIRLLAQH